MEREELVREIKAIWVDDDSYKKVEDCYFAIADLVAAARAQGFREGLEAAASMFDADANEVEKTYPNHDRSWPGHVNRLRENAQDIRALAPKKDAE